MGIYGAINSAISGLNAQSRALENISGNVSNSQTIGYKRLDTTFYDLVSGGGATQAFQVSGTAYATSRATNTIAGDISSSEVDTYMAINGEGYFSVAKPADVVDGSTTFSDDTFYTRAGDFEVSKEGYLVNQSGYHLKGFPLDPDTGNAVGDAPAVIQIDTQPIPARATEVVDYQINLPHVPKTENYDGSDPTTALRDPSVSASVDETELSAFLDTSISGGSITVYNENGTEIPLNFRFAKIFTSPPSAIDTWVMYLGNNLSDPSVSDTHYHVLGSLTFDADGNLASFGSSTGGNTAVASGFRLSGFELGEEDVPLPEFTISFADGSMTQFSDPDGIASSVSLSQDGYTAGELSGVSVDEGGRVVASYSNNQKRAVYDIPLATFEAEQELRRVDGAAFAATAGSGEPDFSGGGSVLANSVELSNADIADEFSKLIVTQQAYSANARIVTSADEMLDNALNMVR